MKLFSGLFRSRDKLENKLSNNSYSFFIGQSSSGKRVNERTAMTMSAVYSCVRILSETLASLPLHVYERTDVGSKKATYHSLYNILHNEPNAEMTSFIFRETLMTHLLLWGNAYTQIIRNGKGDVVGLYPLMPDKMTVDRDDNHTIYYEYLSTNGERVRLSYQDVLHIPGLGFDGLVGYSPIAMAKNAIGMSIAAEEYGAKFFSNGATPSGILEHPGTVKNADSLRESWTRGFSGNNSHKVAILEEGMKYTPISISPNEAQFLETRKFQINEIARIFRIPPHMIGDLEKSSFSNIEQQSLEFVKYTLDPWVIRFEQAFNRRLLKDKEKAQFYVKFNVDGLLRGDYQSRMNGYAVGRQNGWMSANDIRTLENLDRIPTEEGGDLYLVNGNMLPLKHAGAFANINKEDDANEEILELENK
ncbi:phage portal protein [Tuanshanicoccus lijuaniae]|uniref:phage portal protein n=1 Tax=Aerococcaceae bacterium zg-1292 TaxID=2774330 RepID=UPI00193622F5|nr:phage portal protein [Aerococcaceae bacterium zg-1292]QQA38049.1 phage portal protein [Aerococcaceae bacterium zg-1292]